MIRPIRTSPPAELPVSLEEFKAFTRVDFPEDDGVILQLLKAATGHLDGYSGILGRCLINQTWRVDIADWPACAYARLPFPDVTSPVSVKYSDADDAEQTLDSSNFQLIEDARGGLVRFVDDFSAPAVFDDREDAVRISFVAGYGATADAVPMELRVAVMMLARHWYDSGTGAVPASVTGLVGPFARKGV